MTLLPFAVLALAGSLHCAGMCGGFAALVASGAGPRRGRALLHLLLYALGKAATYAVLGALAARAGHLLAHDGALPPLRAGLAWAAALAMAALGLAHLGVRLPAPAAGLAARLAAPARSALAAARAGGGWSAALGTWLLTGLLPCWLTGAALLLASQSDPLTGAAGLFAFGLATSPALLAAGGGWTAVPAAWRARARPVLGALLIVFAVAVAARGTSGAPPAWAAPLVPECCADEAG